MPPRTRSRGRIGGVKRKECFGPSNLKEEVKKKKRLPHEIFSIGILGTARSGRKTLAYRLTHDGLGIIEDGVVPTDYFYRGRVRGVYPHDHPADPLGLCTIELTAYIIQPAIQLLPLDPPLYWDHWSEIKCWLFAFDVGSHRSFIQITGLIARFMHFVNPSRLIYVLVGNKGDTRESPPPLPENPAHFENQDLPVPRDVAERAAEICFIDYYECSAKFDSGIAPLFIWIFWLVI